jgi:hypothetical protein
MIHENELYASMGYHGARYIQLRKWLPREVVNIFSFSLGHDSAMGVACSTFREIGDCLSDMRFKCCLACHVSHVADFVTQNVQMHVSHTYIFVQHEYIKFSRPYHIFEVFNGVPVEKCLSIDAPCMFTGSERIVMVR